MNENKRNLAEHLKIEYTYIFCEFGDCDENNPCSDGKCAVENFVNLFGDLTENQVRLIEDKLYDIMQEGRDRERDEYRIRY